MLADCVYHRHCVPNFEGNCVYLLVFGNVFSVLCIGEHSCSMLDFEYRAFNVLLAPAPICYLSPFHFNTGWKYSRCIIDIEESQEAVTENSVFSHSLKTEVQKELSSVLYCSETRYRKCNL